MLKFGFTGADAQEKSDDFGDFLNVLAGFLPHSYLTSRISSDTKCWEDVWNIIYTHYNCKISGDTLLDFEALNRESDENYQQFYERLLQHTRLHMAPAQSEVGKLKITKADEMSITVMNMVALQWLRKSERNLINIVKTEYSTELKSGIQLAHLVPTIAPNIDNLLSRYSSSSVQKVAVDEEHDEDDDTEDDSDKRFKQQDNATKEREAKADSLPEEETGNLSDPQHQEDLSHQTERTHSVQVARKLQKTRMLPLISIIFPQSAREGLW